MRILPFRAHIPHIEGDATHFTRHIRDNFVAMLAKGLYQTLPNVGFLVCQIQTATRTHTGFIALTDIRDFINGSIKKHEGILSEKEAHHKNMTVDRNAMVKPVLLAYWKSNRVIKLLTEITAENTPDKSFSFVEEGQIHAFWVVDTPEKIAAFQFALADIGYSFIADGHHRAASMAALYQETNDARYQYLLSAYFATAELKILPFHRMLKYPHHDTRHFELLQSMSLLTPIDAPVLPKKLHSITVFYKNQWYKMLWRLHFSISNHDRDLELLNDYFFSKCPDFDAAKQLVYIEGTQPLETIIEKATASPNNLLFLLSPIKFKAIQNAFMGGIMRATFPAKSTWFEPRIKSGLVAYLLE
jgi:uncharacterized protein (DUF1015 family)